MIVIRHQAKCVELDKQFSFSYYSCPPNCWTSDVQQLGGFENSVIIGINVFLVIELKKIMDKAQVIFFVEKDFSFVDASVE